MRSISTLSALLALAASSLTSASPLAESSTPLPGFSETYVNYTGVAVPYPGNETEPVVPKQIGRPAPDDVLWQNLLSAEWIIFSFYQSAVEKFTPADFTDAGFANDTWDRIAEIRDNEAGHLKIMQDSISKHSVQPGACKYTYPYNDTKSFIALQALIEISSEAFLSGLVMQAKVRANRGPLLTLGQVEARHNAWTLMSAFKTSPFVGASDTVYPYPNQILDTTNQFVVPGSCPKANPQYPNPSQHLPSPSPNTTTSANQPGDEMTIYFPPHQQPGFKHGKPYYAVFFHGVYNVSVPFDTTTLKTTIPKFDSSGLILMVVADRQGAPTKESTLTGPIYLLNQPAGLTNLDAVS